MRLLHWCLHIFWLYYLPSVLSSTLIFSRIAATAPWSPRASFSLFSLEIPTVYLINGTSVTAPVGSFILYGGTNDTFSRFNTNDVWLGLIKDSQWIQLSSVNSIFPRFPYYTFCYDPIITQVYAMSYNVLTDDLYPFWTSVDSTHWTSINPRSNNSNSVSPFVNRYQFSCFVDSQSTIYRMMGVNASEKSFSQEPYRDIWSSVDNGFTWNLLTNDSNITPRYGALVQTQINNTYLNVSDVFYILGGAVPNGRGYSYIMDLWVSSDQAHTWSIINGNVFKFGMDESTFKISKDGILIVSSLDRSGDTAVSDIWTSLNGGYSWSKCISNAIYGARENVGLSFDPEGYLYVTGGYKRELSNKFYNDVWRSNISVYDWETWASACGTTVPIGGVGLQKWPDESSSSSSSSSSTGSCNFSSSSALASSSSHSYSSSNTYTSSSSLISSSDRPVESSSSSTGTLHILNQTNWGLWTGLITGIVAVITLIGIFLYLRYLKRRYGRIQWFCCRTRSTSNPVNNRLLGSEL
jgi:hypothetical protein